MNYAGAEGLGDVVEAAGTYTDLVTLAVLAADFEPNETYLGLWSADGELDGTAGRFGLRATDTGDTITSTVMGMQDISPPDQTAAGGLFFHEPGASPANETFKVQGARITSGTATFRNARLSLLKLGADDHYVENIAGASNATTSLTTAETLTFTPATTGDYIVFVSFSLNNNNSGVLAIFEVSDGVTTIGEYATGANADGASLPYPITVALFIAGASGEQNITLKHRTGNVASACVVTDIRMVAIREDRFANVYKTRLSSNNTGTQTTFTTALSQTFTPAAGDHLTIAAFGHSGSNATESSYARYDDGGTVVNNGIREQSALGDVFIGAIGHRIAEYTAASRTQQLERKIETSATAHIKGGSAIITLELPANHVPTTYQGSATLTGSGSLTSSAKRARHGASGLTGSATMTSAAKRARHGSASLTVSATMTAGGALGDPWTCQSATSASWTCQ